MILMFSAVVFVPQASAQTYQDRNWDTQQDNRSYRRNRRNRRYERQYVVRNEYRYVRIGRRVYKETYRSTYTRYGQLVRRQLIARERVQMYDSYDDYRFRRETGSGFNIYLKF